MIVIEIKSKKHGVRNVFIDGEDFDKIKGYKWCLQVRNNTNTLVVATNIKNGSRQKQLRITDIIMNRQKGQVVDHINHNTLDNRKENLRLCTQSENLKNSSRHKDNASSKYKGVYLDKKSGSFYSRISFNYKRINLGSFKTEVDAAEAYNIASLKYYGEFAHLNKIKG